ncbi:MAG TPA: hypothetical protein ENG98_04995 [Actinobacteria bacterium]|nr:hypothetical protein BMS3Bbin02_01709 [bacterium BMS3Bbin02]HDL42352.1 hypothetical protein [Actinomycetota bacterium]
MLELIHPHEAGLFWRQSTADLRHAVETARKVADTFPDDRTVQRAALWHDIGKVESQLTALGRATATVARTLRVPRSRRWRAYDEHGPRGAVQLEALKCEPLVIAFARYHPQGAPPEYDVNVWNALLAADDD